jgi:hypothetical protein
VIFPCPLAAAANLKPAFVRHLAPGMFAALLAAVVSGPESAGPPKPCAPSRPSAPSPQHPVRLWRPAPGGFASQHPVAVARSKLTAWATRSGPRGIGHGRVAGGSRTASAGVASATVRDRRPTQRGAPAPTVCRLPSDRGRFAYASRNCRPAPRRPAAAQLCSRQCAPRLAAERGFTDHHRVDFHAPLGGLLAT